MKILFIIVEDDDKDKFLFKSKSHVDTALPLGIAQLGAVLEKEKHEVQVLDLRFLRRNYEKEIKNKIQKFKPDIINLSSYFYSIINLIKTARIIKKDLKIPIIVGGIHPSLFPFKILDKKDIIEFLKKEKTIDYIITGEGEVVLSKLLKAIKTKGKGKKKTIFPSKEKSIVKNLDTLPFPAFNLFDIKKYTPLPKHYKRTPVIPMITSRGCNWGQCTFCCQPDIKGYYRKQSPGRVVAEIKHFVNKYNIKEVRFWDDNFIHGKKWIIDFCNLMIKEKEKQRKNKNKKNKFDIIWSCHSRVNMITPEIINKMVKAGCWQIMYGIESGVPELLKKVNKGITLDQAKKAVKWAKRGGMEVRVSFILGLPGETPNKSDKTIRFAEKLNADIVQFSLFTPYPGTKVSKTLRTSKRLRLDKDITKYCEYRVVYVPKGYKNKKEVEKKYRDAYKKMYINPKYIFKSLKNIKNIDDVKRYYAGLQTILGLIYKKRKT